ncbi:MAG: hypothetical protein JRJ84_23585, partial [Deltaproteobacteria bacterium]|nr:hypothetical protein [Deltaproteobacteria bacterium]
MDIGLGDSAVLETTETGDTAECGDDTAYGESVYWSDEGVPAAIPAMERRVGVGEAASPVDDDFFEAYGVTWADEVVELRDADAFTFDRGDGNLVSLLTAGPVNHRASDGTFQPINTRLRRVEGDATFGWANETNTLQSRFAAEGADGLELRSGEAVARWLPTHRAVEYPDGGVDRLPIALGVPAAAEGSVVRYAGTYPDTTEVFDLGAALGFAGELHLSEGLSVWVDGVEQHVGFTTHLPIELRGREGTPVFEIEPPITYEMHNPNARVDGEYRVALVGDGVLELTVVTPLDWLVSAIRSYPVVVDPTISTLWASSGTYPVYRKNNCTTGDIVRGTSSSYFRVGFL